MKHVKRLSCLALAAIMLFLCSGCGSPEPPPEYKDVAAVFRENRSDFLLITDYLTGLGGDSVIDETNGTVRRRDYHSYAYAEEQIGDPEVEAAVERLLIDRKIKKIYKNADTIPFYLWGNALPPSECGIAYKIVVRDAESETPDVPVEDAGVSADDENAPEEDAAADEHLNVEYLVRREPLPEQDWYYYLSDYSEWSSGSPLS